MSVSNYVQKLEEELAQTTSEEFTELPTPKEIMDHLNEYVIGQEKAKIFSSCSI